MHAGATVDHVDLFGFAPDLNGDALDGQWDGRLGLGGLHPDAFKLVLGEQSLGDGGAEALQGTVRALLGDERDQLAHLGVIDGVLQPVGGGGVGLAEIRHLSFGMSTLVMLGSLAALGVSYAVLLAPGAFPPGARDTYFEAAASVVTCVLVGKLIEARAK